MSTRFPRLLTGLLVLLALAACAANRVEQVPEKQAIADRLHRLIMANMHPYPVEHGRKVMYGCIDWSNKTSPKVRDINWYFTETFYRYSASVMAEMHVSASGACNAAKSKQGLDCRCQAIDVNGDNVILVP